MTKPLTDPEWERLNHLRQEISFNPAAIAPADQEEFSTLFARTLAGKGDQPIQEKYDA